MGDAVRGPVSLGAVIAAAARGRAARREAVVLSGGGWGVEALLEDGGGVHQPVPVNPEHSWRAVVSVVSLVSSGFSRRIQAGKNRAFGAAPASFAC